MLIDLQDFKGESEFLAKLNRSTGSHRARTSSGLHPAARGGVLRGSPARIQWLAIAAAVLLFAAVGGFLLLRKSRISGGAPLPRTLAVLPFQNLKPEPQTDFLGFSLADEIITKLGYVNSLTVRPSSSVAKYRSNTEDPKKIAADLKVGTLLTGNYVRDGNNLRITTQLVDVNSDRILWRDNIDVHFDDLLSVQDRVTQQIIKELEVNLSPSEAAHIAADKAVNSLAYEYYLRGIDLYSINEFRTAVGMLEKSTEIEPNYAPAWAHLGRAYTTYASLQFGGRDYYRKAQSAYEKALALNPALVEPRIYMANLFTDTGRVEQAVPLLRSALRDSANDAEAHWELGYAYRFGGMLPESIAEANRARQIDPLVKINSSAMNSYLYVGDYQKFLDTLPVNDSAYILFYRGLAEYYLGRRNDALHDFDSAYNRDSSSLQAMIGKALSYSLQQQNSQGLEMLRRTETQIQERGVTDAEGMYKVAQAYAVLGDKASALRVFQQTVNGGFFCSPYFERDPLLRNLSGMSDFQEIMKQAIQRHQQFKGMFF